MVYKVVFVQWGFMEMFFDQDFLDFVGIVSINVYLGVFFIVWVLVLGVDIVIIGCCVDSVVMLGVCIDVFGWKFDEFDCLVGGLFVGYIFECGLQVIGGNFIDWYEVVDLLVDIGYFIVEVFVDGFFVCIKLENMGGQVIVVIVVEQVFYEIGDFQVYVLLDVVCDFFGIQIEQQGFNWVLV